MTRAELSGVMVGSISGRRWDFHGARVGEVGALERADVPHGRAGATFGISHNATAHQSAFSTPTASDSGPASAIPIGSAISDPSQS